MLSKQVIAILNESDTMSGKERTDFVKTRFEELEQTVKKTYHA
jgi:hypothetical protein